MRYIATWFWPAFSLIFCMTTGHWEDSTISLFQVGLLGCITSAVYLTYDFFHDGDAVYDILDVPDIGSHICRIGVIVDVLILVAGLFGSRLTVITDWFASNGTLLNLIYLGALLLIGLFYFLSKHSKGGASAFSQKEMAKKPKQALGLLLLIPALMILAFNGHPVNRMDTLKPIPLSELSIINYITLASLAITLLRLMIQDGFIHKNWSGVWQTFFISSILMVVSFCYLVLERVLVAELGNTWLGIIFNLLFLAIDTFFLLYSYVFIFYPILSISMPMLGAYGDGEEEDDQERKAYKKKLDDQERMFNAITGTGPFTDLTAAELGLKSAQEYLTDQLYREEKLREYDRKHGKD